MTEFDIYDIGSRVKEIDAGLHVVWDRSKAKHVVYHEAKYGLEHVMDNPFRILDGRLLQRIRMIDTGRGDHNQLREIDEHNERLKRSQDNSFENDTHEMSKEAARAVLHDLGVA